MPSKCNLNECGRGCLACWKNRMKQNVQVHKFMNKHKITTLPYLNEKEPQQSSYWKKQHKENKRSTGQQESQDKLEKAWVDSVREERMLKRWTFNPYY